MKSDALEQLVRLNEISQLRILLPLVVLPVQGGP